MRRLPRRLVVAAMACALAMSAQAGPHLAGFNDAQIEWRDIEAGLAEARRTGKPVFLLVHATWCPTCRKYRSVFSDPEIVALSKDFVFVLVDRDKEAAASAAYAPDGEYIPRSMMLTSEGVLRPELNAGRQDYRFFVNPSDPRQLRSLLKAALAE